MIIKTPVISLPDAPTITVPATMMGTWAEIAQARGLNKQYLKRIARDKFVELFRVAGRRGFPTFAVRTSVIEFVMKTNPSGGVILATPAWRLYVSCFTPFGAELMEVE